MRAKKESTPVSVRMDIDVFRRLEKYCEDSGQSKTVVIERAIMSYIDAYEEMMKKVTGNSSQ